MSDIADILGLASKGAPVDETAAILNDKVKKTAVLKKKPKGMSREVFDLVGSDSFVSSVQSNPQVSGFKSKRSSVLKGKWIWDSIKNSARSDKDQVTFFHWVKADVSYPDYPYAKFNIALDELTLTREQYDTMAQDNAKWSFEDTSSLLSTCHKFALRWPIIYDRIQLSTPKRIEEIQARYYQVHSFQTNSSFKFNLERETNRRLQQDLLFKKTKEDEIEETKLREELKNIDAALKKYKKLIKPSAPAVAIKSESKVDGKAPSETSSSSSSAGPIPPLPPLTIASSSALHLVVDHTPAPGRPCLQSGRLQSGDAGLSKNLIKKVNAYLTQLNLPAKPAATRSVCDTLDSIRRDTATLLSLHASIAKREKDKLSGGLLTGAGAGGTSGVTVKTEKKSSKPAAAGGAAGATAGAAGATPAEPKPKKTSTKRKSGSLDEKPTTDGSASNIVDSMVMPSDMLMGGSGGANAVVGSNGNSSTGGGNKAKKVCV